MSASDMHLCSPDEEARLLREAHNVGALRKILNDWSVPAPELVGKLPKLSCSECSKRENRGQCSQHNKTRCKDCGAWISTAHVHLDYMGHAEVRRALIEIDPLWSWEPTAWTDDGAPAIIERKSELVMWGRLTVLGKTLPCAGSVPHGTFDADKQLIGDLLRNGAMSFGVALSLWSKQEWADARDPVEPPHADPPSVRPIDRDAFKAALAENGLTEADVCLKASRGGRATLDEFGDTEAPALRAAYAALLAANKDTDAATAIADARAAVDNLADAPNSRGGM